ncbi:glycosyltransferase family 2 protein [Microvirga pudoricolor]|uniref:glycosyltransferase family 2 protein n=1 Tax=Microvirga pudoricolor TaxID=2778729 RepID=UPI001950C2C3|nr:glycosyltransferase family 2 protein [Microvirga pudoricolor]MBM6593713.1 glycosyltransferase [Microvirga pudoricolor]
MRISIVTPALNSRSFLGPTMDGVLAADHGDLEYIVMDGGSTDGSQDVIAARRNRLKAAVSAPDEGLYDALNKGFALSTGEIMGWINAGDALFPDSLRILDEIFTVHPEVEWVTSRVISFLDERGRLVEQAMHWGIDRDGYLRGEHLPGFSRGRSLSLIQQESTFWRRSLWERAGARLDTSYRLAADFELWARFFRHAELWSISAPLGAFRRHADQLSAIHWDKYLAEAKRALEATGARPRNGHAQSLSVGLRRSLPRSLRPLASRLRLFRAAPFCEFDTQGQTWRLTRF